MVSVTARRARTALAVAGAVASAVAVSVVVASSPDSAAVVDEPATRHPAPVGELVVVFDIGEVDQFVVEASARAAATAGGSSTVGRTGSLGMRQIRRGSTVVHAPPAGYLIPMAYSSLPANPMSRVMGYEVTAVLGPGKVVMHELSASITGAAAGDTIVLQSASGTPVPLEIVAIASQEQIGSAELVFTYDVATSLGAAADTRVIIHDADRDVLDIALEAEGLEGRADTRVYRSWDPPDPDGTLSTVHTKELLGEPWYRFNADGSVSMHPTWEATYLPEQREFLNETIRIWTRCHHAIRADIEAALADVVDAGLASEIDFYNANRIGGCYTPRFSRMSGQIGSLSRHSYGQALDTNTTTNCLGCVPQMDCDVVRIFRKHGFAWGGNFRRPDGMHFEWVGERRDQMPYDSGYCPNLTGGLIESVGGPTLGLSVLTLDGEDPLHVHHDDHGHQH